MPSIKVRDDLRIVTASYVMVVTQLGRTLYLDKTPK